MIYKSFLSDRCKEIIFGSLLGDGSLRLHKPYKNARFSFRHSAKQKEYFFWKVEQLKEISSKDCWWKQDRNMLRYQSLAMKPLTDLYKITHEHGKLVIRRKWLNRLTALSLAIWWFDDGSLISNGRKGVLCTDPFSYKEQKLLAHYLYKVWNVKTAIGKVTRVRDGKIYTYYRLWLRSTEELKKFLRIILPFVQIPSLLPKVLLLYKDSQLQQRWISEVSRLTGFSSLMIEKCVEEKKAKWRIFRK